MTERLAFAIKHTSYWRFIYSVSYFLLLFIIIILIGIPWWWQVVILLTGMVLCIYSFFNSNSLLHLSGPKLNQNTKRWQIMLKGHKQPELWEAELIKTRDLSHCIQLTFLTLHPVIKSKTAVIWQDQVDAESWRRLKVLCRW